MSQHTFKVNWEVTVIVDAETEEEAWENVHDAIDHAWGKSLGHKSVDLVEDDQYEEEEWELFDRDPEGEGITFQPLDDLDF